jgi:hypothetical protein
MPRQSKYGNMPPAPEYTAKVKGDAGTYRVLGIDWMHHRILLDRACLEWTPIEKVAFEPVPADAGSGRE